MNFNFGATKGASEAPKMLTAGIHTATFKGIKKETITTKAGDDMDVMQVTFNVKDFGEYKQNCLLNRQRDIDFLVSTKGLIEKYEQNKD